jgi:hypothetical protein
MQMYTKVYYQVSDTDDTQDQIIGRVERGFNKNYEAPTHEVPVCASRQATVTNAVQPPRAASFAGLNGTGR